jgi:hypothetical protein
MNDSSPYKQIIEYMDNLHRDIGQLVILIERLMEENGYMSLPSAGNRACWYLSSHYATPDKWRVPHLSRFYIPEGREESDHTLLYLILLNSDSTFPFPVVLSARVSHPLLAEKEIYSNVWHSENLAALAAPSTLWTAHGEKEGWFGAEPTFKSAIERLHGYFLNLFDLVDRQHVIDNIIIPLTTEDANLDQCLTIPKYGFKRAEEKTT